MIAVTGANGFIGSHAVRRLLQDGHEVLALGRRAECVVEHPRLRYRRWDITSGAIAAGRVEAVVHCAGSVTEWGRDEDFQATNVDGTRHVLESFSDASVFVNISTASVYDLTTPKPMIDEETPVAAQFISAYSRSKVAAEELVARRTGCSVTLRPHIVYGPGDAKILPRLLAMRRAGAVVVPGDGKNHLSLTHVDNLTEAIARAIERGHGHGVFNIADGVTGTVNELLTSFQIAFGFEPRIRHLPVKAAWSLALATEALHRTVLAPRTPVLTRFVVAQLAFEFTLDISLAESVLGYQPTRSYGEAFEELALVESRAQVTNSA